MLATMASILIRDVPDDVRVELAARAARAGQSMQEYLKAALIEMTAKPSIEEWLERVRDYQSRPGFKGATSEQIVAELRDMRGTV
jgi:antitoxin FitA